MKKVMVSVVLCLMILLACTTGKLDEPDPQPQPQPTTPQELFDRYYYFLTGGSSLDAGDADVAEKLQEINADAQSYWDSMVTSANRSFVWSDLPMVFTEGSTTIASSYEMTNTFLRLSVMAQAYRLHGGELYGNTDLGDAVLDAIIWMNEHKFRPGTRYGNWWDWEIGSPLRFIDCIVLMKDTMTQAQLKNATAALRSHVHTNAPKPGDANSMWNLFIRLMIGILDEDNNYIQAVINGTDNEWFRYTNFRDGFYPDGSYIMHGDYPYTGSYGASAIENLAKLMYIVNGTSYDISGASKAQAVQWINESYAPVMYQGLMMDNVRGRSISRQTEGDHMIGHVVVRSIYLISLTLPANTARPLQELVKYWIQSAAHRSIFQGEDITNNNNYVFFINALKQLMNDTSVPTAGKPVFNKQFTAMARVVHSRPHFTFAVSMYSDTIRTHEAANGENSRAWHTASGMTYLYNDDLGHYSDDFWPTLNPYRPSGTTVIPNSTISGYNGDTWVGGTTIDGLYGISGMHLKPSGQTLSAQKSWFMFDDEIVALGSGIQASSPVETIIENRKLNPGFSNVFTVDGSVPAPSTVVNPTWMHLAGIAGNPAGSDIGYYFPLGGDVQFVRQTHSGRWGDINTNTLMASDTLLQAEYLTLLFNHGSNPSNASYAYVLLPGKSAAGVKSYSSNPDITILENSERAHGVYEHTLGITGVNFWNDEVTTVGPITSNRKSSIMVRETSTQVHVSIAEPAGWSGLITIQFDYIMGSLIAKDNNITVVGTVPLVILVNTAGKDKMPSYISFNKGSDVTQTPPTGIQLNHSVIDMGIMDEISLSATVLPASASQFVVWSSSNTGVAEVVSGIVTPVSGGQTIISATTLDGLHVALCTVNVTSYNVALGKPATENNESTKHQGDRPFPASFAVDGLDDNIHRWAADRNGTQDWLQIDLGANYSIEGVRISWENFAIRYRLQISNISSGGWETIYTETNGEGGYQTIKFDTPHNGRYFRLFVSSDDDKNLPQFGASVREIWIYGK